MSDFAWKESYARADRIVESLTELLAKQLANGNLSKAEMVAAVAEMLVEYREEDGI